MTTAIKLGAALCGAFLLASAASAGQWTYDDSTELLTHGETGWVLETTVYDGTNLMVTGVGAAPAAPSALPLGDAVGGGYWITDIDIFAFGGCAELTDVAIPDSVVDIGAYAFCNCSALTNVAFGSGVKFIAEEAFMNCAALTRVVIPDNVTGIGDGAFSGCAALADVVIGNGVTRVGDLFPDCDALASVVIGNGVTDIEDGAFAWREALTNVVVGSGVAYIGEWAFGGCIGLTGMMIPDSVEHIGDEAFAYCTSLTNAMAGSGVTYLGDGAFAGCTALAGVLFKGEYPADYAGDYIFDGAGYATVYVTGAHAGSWGANMDAGALAADGVAVWRGRVVRLQGDAGTGNVWIYDGNAGLLLHSGAAWALYADEEDGMGLTVTFVDGQPGAPSALPLDDAVVGGYRITAIENGAFESCAALADVVIPDSVEYIGNYAFCECAALTNAVIGSGVTAIEDETFFGCAALAGVVIPDSVEYIGNYAFAYCAALKSVTIGSGVTDICEGAFYGCAALAGVVIPDSVEYIGYEAFAGCAGLASAVIGRGVTLIAEMAFSGCAGLTGVEIPASVEYLGDGAFSGCAGLTNVLFRGAYPADYAGDDIFDGADSVTVYITSGHAASWSDCLEGSIAGGDATWQGVPVRQTDGAAEDNVWVYSPSSGRIIHGGTAWALYAETDGGFNLIITGVDREPAAPSALPLGDAVMGGYRITAIEEYAFAGCDSLTGVVIPDSVEHIGEGTFADCYGLTDVVIPGSVEYIGDYAFSYCGALESVTIGKGVTYIGDGAFGDCYGLTGVVIPDSVDHIGEGAFAYCPALESVTIGKGVTYIGEWAFGDCYGLTGVVIPDSVEHIGDYAFAYCEALESVTIGKGVTDIGWGVFEECVSLADITVSAANTAYRSIGGVLFTKDGKLLILCPMGKTGAFNIPAGVTHIGDDAFAGCAGLTGVTIPASVVDIGDYAFAWSGLKSVTIPGSGATAIGKWAFAECINLASVTFGSGVAAIGNWAFRKCLSLTDVVFEGERPATVGHEIFDGADHLTLFVRLAHAQAWNDAIDDGRLEDGDAVWQGIPVRVWETDFMPFVTTVALSKTVWAWWGTHTDLVYRVDIPEGATRLRIASLDFAGGWESTCSMYVRHGEVPSATANGYDYADTRHEWIMPGGSGIIYERASMSVVIPQPEAGAWYILLTDIAGYGEISLTVSYDTPPPPPSLPPPPAPPMDDSYLSDPKGAINADAAPVITTAYAGFIYDDAGAVCGTVTLTAKESKGSWSYTAKAVLQDASVSFSLKGDAPDGVLELPGKSGETLTVTLGEGTLAGTLTGGKVSGTLHIAGARDAFADKKDGDAQNRLAPLKGYYTAALISGGSGETALPAGYLTLTVGNGGSVKIAGKLADGTAVSGSAKMQDGLNKDGWLAIPLHKPLYSKKGSIGGLLWLDPVSKILRVDTANGWYIDWTLADATARPLDICGGWYGTGVAFDKPAYLFSADVPELPPLVDGLKDAAWVTDAFPQDVEVTAASGKLTIAKAAAAKKPAKDAEPSDYIYDEANPSCATISHTAKTGIFKGSFKLYHTGMSNGAFQHKTANASYTGILIPTRDAAYAAWPLGLGTGTVKIGSEKVEISVELE